MTTHIEEGFPLFSEDEISRGMKYAAEHDHVTLDYRRLKVIANNAGKSRINASLTPRQAVSRALQAYHNEYPAVNFPSVYFEGYVHAVAKMLNWRSPKVKAKRERDEAQEELEAAFHGLDEAQPIDPEVNRQIALGQTGDLFEDTTADAH